MTGAMAGPNTTPMPNTAIARPCLDFGKLVSKKDWLMGARGAANTPCKIRDRIKVSRLVASPHSRVATVKQAIEMSNIKRREKRLTVAAA